LSFVRKEKGKTVAKGVQTGGKKKKGEKKNLLLIKVGRKKNTGEKMNDRCP